MDIAITPEDAAGPPAARWPFWRALGWGVVVMAISTIVQGLAFAVVGLIDRFYLHRTLGPSASLFEITIADAQRGDILAMTVILSDFACVFAIFLIVAFKGSPAAGYLALYRVRAPVMLKWIAILLAYIVLASGGAMLFHIDFGGAAMENIFTDSQHPLLFWIAVAVAAPAFEEIFFRGFLFRGFEASFLKTWGTIVLTAILWASLHIQYNVYGIAFIAGVGILFGLARARTGSLIVPLALHAAMNFGETAVYALYGA